MLEAEGRLLREGAGWRVGPRREPAGSDGTAPAAAVDALTAPVLAAHPLYAPELEILRAGARHLPDILTGVTDPLQVLFPDGSQSLTERVYRDSRTFGVYNALAREAVRRLVATLPPDATLNIVEVGGGTGSLTAAVLDLLPPSRTRYLFTDVSAAFVQKAEVRFGSWGFVDFAVFDLEADPSGQGLSPGRAHLVLAADVLHATSDIARSLRHVRSLLSPGGQLLALELTRPPFWFDLVFGLLSGWWGFSDESLRPDHACLSGTAWRACLAGAGFDDIALLADGDDPDASVHSVILARSPAPAEERATGEAAGPDDVLTTDVGDSWLVLEDDGHVGAGLDRELGGGGRVSSSPAGAVLERDALAAADRQGILFLGASAPSLRDGMAPGSVMEITGGLCARLLALLQTLADGGAGAARLLVVTRGAMAVLPGDEVDPGQAALWGLARVFMNEHPDVPCGLVDLSGRDTVAPVELRALADLCRAGADDEQERALRGAGRFLHRLDRIAPDHLAPGADRRRRTGEPVRLDFARTGAFEHLLVRSAGPSGPGPDEVEIEAAAAGLNFRDIMKLLGIYPTERDERPVLGDECAGTVLSVGARVDRFKPGDRVVAIGSGFSSRLSVDHRLVARLPDGLDFADGATLPIVFLTAHYALRHLAGLEPGERVLIHAGAGGVGQAAIQIAQGVGARIFATAGSEEKRAHLRGMGIADVFDSRSLDFAQQIMAVTGGQGVDVVLNSLSGRAIEKSLGLLGPYGRFLEIGKTDIYRDSRIGLRPFRRNLSYFAIDLDAILHQRRDLARRLLDEVMAEASAGRIAPLPHSTFPLRDAPRAFRHMAQARHIGKVVLDLSDPEVAVAPRRFEALPLAADATYLVTGGLGGVGRSLARWMVDQGARHLVLLSRGAGSDEARAFCASLSGPGTLVEARACDVTDEAALSGELDRLRARGRPIRGVIHAAMVLDDGLIPQLDRDRLDRVLAPKIAGAWALDRATAADPLDFFVMFSSFASLVGNIGQANYSAANAFLDALAQRRRRQGRPALTVNWGAIGAVGYVADHAEIEQHFQRLGLQSMEPAAAFRALETLLRWDASEAGVVDIDWAGWSRHAPAIAKSARFRHLIADDGSGSETGAGEAILDRLRDASSEERPVILLGAVREQLAAVLGLSPDEVDASQAPSALGLDSLMAVEFSCLIEDRLGFKPATLELIQAPSLAALVDRFSEKIAI
ncbi:MAG: SDR family NAD(P)-dependent oxidoreductase [Telmatospirillum sp.]|nr:SDR family NAD(P)-dependent oxidoreductase [Telmatospirillum sp.]